MQLPNHTQLSNEIIDHYMADLTGSEFKCLVAIARKTIGWHKESDSISLTQLEKITGSSRQTVINATESLEENDIITVDRSGRINKYDINYDSLKNRLVKKLDQEESNNKTSDSLKTRHTKETNTKDTKQKILVAGKAFDEKSLIKDVLQKVDLSKSPETEQEKYALLALHLWSDVNELRPNNQITLKAKLGNWYDPVRLMVEQDKRTIKEIWDLWKRVQRDQFWKSNILSTDKLREKFDQLSIKLNKNKRNLDAVIDSLYG